MSWKKNIKRKGEDKTTNRSYRRCTFVEWFRNHCLRQLGVHRAMTTAHCSFEGGSNIYVRHMELLLSHRSSLRRFRPPWNQWDPEHSDSRLDFFLTLTRPFPIFPIPFFSPSILNHNYLLWERDIMKKFRFKWPPTLETNVGKKSPCAMKMTQKDDGSVLRFGEFRYFRRSFPNGLCIKMAKRPFSHMMVDWSIVKSDIVAQAKTTLPWMEASTMRPSTGNRL